MPKAKVVDGAARKAAKGATRKDADPSAGAVRRGATAREGAKPGAGKPEGPGSPRRKPAAVSAAKTASAASKPARKPGTATRDAAKARTAKTRAAKTGSGQTRAKKSGSRKASPPETGPPKAGATRTRTNRRTPTRALSSEESFEELVASAAPSNAGTAAPTGAVERVVAHAPARALDPESTPPVVPGESRLLLLVRDPNTLFATWEMDPSASAALNARIGSRALAVSTFTIRLTSAGGGTRVVHLSRRAKSRYLKVDGASSYVAEIGLTTPTGRFEFVARSAPCFVPTLPSNRQAGKEARRPAVLGYREARALARRGLLFSSLRESMQRQSRPADARATSASGGRGTASPAGAPLSTSKVPSVGTSASPRPTSLTSRVLGGASDLYRR